MRRLALLAAGALLVSCGEQREAAATGGGTVASADAGEAEATELGREIYRILDLAADYRGSHRGRPPTSLRALGVDSLTPTVARHLAVVDGEVHATAEFRDAGARTYRACTGTLRVLEEAVLGEGRYTLTCTTQSGESRSVQAGSALE